jgi:ABC-type polysaccharide/polyol phosphate export permease
MAADGGGRYHGGVSGSRPSIRLLAYRDSLFLLTSRHLKLRYRRSALGFVWTLVYPVLSTAILTLVFARVFVQIEQYPLHAMTGVLVWHFFSLTCLQGCDALLGAAPLIRKVYVPTAVFPMSVVAANLVNFMLCVAVLPALMVLVGVVPGFHPWLLVFALVVLAAFTTGVTLALAAINVFFHDVRYLFEAILLVWFYATPVVYPTAVLEGASAVLVSLNPLHWILILVRGALDPVGAFSWSSCLVAGLLALVSAISGWALYWRAEARFHLYL